MPAEACAPAQSMASTATMNKVLDLWTGAEEELEKPKIAMLFKKSTAARTKVKRALFSPVWGVVLRLRFGQGATRATNYACARAESRKN